MVEVQQVHYDTFRAGSKTYFNSTRFFPPRVRDDVFLLYAFVRVADNFVDRIPQDGDGFERFVKDYERTRDHGSNGDAIIDGFIDVAERHNFRAEWIDAFFHSMRMDLHKKHHVTIDESLEYIYGSAEVIGLFMARIIDLPERSYHAARLLGRAMQYINFIRDIAEDNELGRIYLPISESSLPSLDERIARENPREFQEFIRRQLDRYIVWQGEAESGYHYIPRRYRVPIKTAGDMYKWTGHAIAEDPFIVFRQKVKPNKARIVLSGLLNMVVA